MPRTPAPLASTPACVQYATVFQHPLLEESPASSAPTEVRRAATRLERQADDLCRACPALTDCLFRAVVQHDVSGFVAGTTSKQRLAIRRQLAVTVAAEDLDSLAGVTRRHRQVDHDEIVRLRQSNPHESLEQLAQRLGCSLSTVKRHLRDERHSPAGPPPAAPVRPGPQQVRRVAAEVLSGRTQRIAA